MRHIPIAFAKCETKFAKCPSVLKEPSLFIATRAITIRYTGGSGGEKAELTSKERDHHDKGTTPTPQTDTTTGITSTQRVPMVLPDQVSPLVSKPSLGNSKKSEQNIWEGRTTSTQGEHPRRAPKHTIRKTMSVNSNERRSH